MTMTATEFANAKFNWLAGVVRDPRLNRSATVLGVATLYAARYINRKTRDAWVGKDTLATDLGVDRRSTQYARKLLVETGWLKLTKMNKGSEHTNRYVLDFSNLKGGADASLEREVPSVRKGGAGMPKGEVPTPPYTVRETGKRTGSRAERDPGAARPTVSQASHSSPQAGKQPSKKQDTRFPTQWKFGAAEWSVAKKLTRWNYREAKAEFERFSDHYEKQPSSNWNKVWRTWCETDYGKDKPRQRLNGSKKLGCEQGIEDYFRSQRKGQEEEDDASPS